MRLFEKRSNEHMHMCMQSLDHTTFKNKYDASVIQSLHQISACYYGYLCWIWLQRSERSKQDVFPNGLETAENLDRKDS